MEKLAEKVKRIKVGDPTDFSTDMGCLISDGQRQNVEKYVAIGKDEGARLVCGGGRPKI